MDGIQVEQFMGWGHVNWWGLESHLAILSQLHSSAPQPQPQYIHIIIYVWSTLCVCVCVFVILSSCGKRDEAKDPQNQIIWSRNIRLQSDEGIFTWLWLYMHFFLSSTSTYASQFNFLKFNT